MNYDMRKSGMCIQQIRILQGYTQEEFARMLNIDRSYLSRIESGKKGCSVDLLVQLSEFLSVPILHLMRGQLYDIEGRTFFTMGGATSHDVEDGILDPDAPDFRVQYARLLFGDRRRSRIIGKSWWPEELPSDGEYTTALDTLERAGWKADYVLTHCAPTSIARQMNRHYQPDTLTDFLELLNNRLEFGCWLFGHYHNNREIDPKHILLWEQIVQLT